MRTYRRGTILKSQAGGKRDGADAGNIQTSQEAGFPGRNFSAERKPELFSGRDCNVEIETASPLTVGMTVVDWWQVTGRKHNARVMKDVDADGFFALLAERVGRL